MTARRQLCRGGVTSVTQCLIASSESFRMRQVIGGVRPLSNIPLRREPERKRADEHEREPLSVLSHAVGVG